MSAFRLTPAAQRDLSEIWDFTQKRWDVVQAEEYIAEIRDAIERVAKEPNRGRRCDEIRDGYRRYVVGSHLVFFVEYEDAIDVIRILHQRMDPTRHM
ncbi:type II toxin-antitoxin system RelE/ParE family toxin [Changpingibacter yushuensis]|uniref:type II toxin-antitoxin system RelE/ParE family toxin n=1 Tax=Changpingibacter yushuensis TaxID=2758440 RepID=UPI0015F374B6|nr:type II toxin-antitoxin system RelE/ParE family toxin [Changpingibacter yushuensis]